MCVVAWECVLYAGMAKLIKRYQICIACKSALMFLFTCFQPHKPNLVTLRIGAASFSEMSEQTYFAGFKYSEDNNFSNTHCAETLNDFLV
jgi:hypothetical protein